ncbi:MAG: CpaF family protein [Lachnospiraceae bacterium]|nr:CpaF family protein [Lachnospiraceae bacterium]
MGNWQDISGQTCSPSYSGIESHKLLSGLQESLIAQLDLSRDMKEEELEELIDGRMLADERIRRLPLELKKRLRRDVFFAIRKLGILQELLADEEITEIMVNGTEPVFVEKAGKITQLPVRFEEKEKLNRVIQQIVGECNRVVNEASPIVDARLQDGSRVNVVLPPVALNGPILTIRRFPGEVMTMEDLIRLEAISRQAAEFLKKAVIAGYNILLSGGTGCGKTTFLNALSGFVPGHERIITIEDSAELKLRGPENLVRLETRNANVDGCKEITIRDLLKTSLRMRPDRIIVGEVRGKEAVDMLQGMNVGHNAMTTIHANSVRDVISRLETMVLMGMELPLYAIRKQITSGIDLMIHLGRDGEGKRRVLEIAEPCVYTGQDVELHTLFCYEDGRLRKKGELLNAEKLKNAGF